MSAASGRSEQDIPTRLDPAEVEPRIGQRWLDSGLWHPEPAGEAAENYSIAIPPPNVTGSLHMGHALNGSVQDVLARYHRMRGRRTKWILGTDHAGIATQAQVEKMLEREEGTSRQELGREAFERRVWQWREHYGRTIIEQFKRLGASCDYADERFTLDERYAVAVQRVFVDLYEKGYIYRGRYLVNWDPGTRSAISDLEVEERHETDTLYSIRYDLVGGGRVTIATVRPETMLGDTAVAVHPEDERYRSLVGRQAILPLVGRELPIIADDYVKPEFGTGQLKVTPAHDANDFEIGQRHDLPAVSVIGEDGRMTAEAGERFAGLSVLEAREAIIAALAQEGRIVAQEPYGHEVPYSHRSGQRIEPLISLQWFMRMDELAGPAIDAVLDGRVRILPDNHRRVYLNWMSSIRPWCISRQLWWGHRLPVWYCDECEETFVGMHAPERCGACGGVPRREEDVLDTWFSSALWPFATVGWPEQTAELRAFYPTSVLSTARDILFLWVARMIMMGLEFAGDVPFRDVYVHSVIQAPDGRRMSKSLGTGIDPLEMIDRHGADATRFGLLAMSSTQDVRFAEEKIEQGQRLANKLWNAARFVLLRVDEGVQPAARPVAPEDRWILSRLERVREATERCIESYDFHHAALGLYDFVYGELCDWYLELAKPRLDSAEVGATLLYVLRRTLAIAHPVIPFVTEELWRLCGGEALLAAGPWPSPEPQALDEDAERSVTAAIEVITAVRGWRDGAGIAPGARVRARLNTPSGDGMTDAIARLARLELDGEAANGTALASIAAAGGSVDVLEAEGLDAGAVAERVARERERLHAEIARAESKLANQGFVAKAPPAVVQGERDKLEALLTELAAL
ncbi:MAG TPA: valine--tRNA ligase [Solirubrobacteraceae bacterium]|nr:valine--tRNA ligase [Solirubrobacteraceae bacterium]